MEGREQGSKGREGVERTEGGREGGKEGGNEHGTYIYSMLIIVHTCTRTCMYMYVYLHVHVHVHVDVQVLGIQWLHIPLALHEYIKVHIQ